MASRHHRLVKDRRPGPFETVVSWGPVLVGVGVMVGLLITAVALPAEDPPPTVPSSAAIAGPSPRASADPADPDGAGTGTAGSGIAPQEPSPSPDPAAPPSAAPPSTVPPPAPAPDRDLVGEYRVEESYGDTFIGQVVITNNTQQALDWTVRLEFPDNVGALQTFWVDGTPQPTMRQSARLHEFSGTVPVGPGSSVILKVLYDRSGADVPPRTCTVNGTGCAVLSP